MPNEYIKFYDTCALLDIYNSVSKQDYFFVSSQTIIELEKIKTDRNKDEDVKYKARVLNRWLKDNLDKYGIVIVKDENYDIVRESKLEVTPDNLIISCAKQLSKDNNIMFVTSDILCYLIAKNIFGLCSKLYDKEKSIELYSGLKEIYLDLEKDIDKQLLSYIYEGKESFNMSKNQYLLVWDKISKQCIDELKFDGERFIKIKPKKIENNFLGTIRPLNIKQKLMFDLLQDESITVKVVNGGFGTGKTFVATAFALQELQKGHFNKIVYIRNNIEVAGTKPIGFLPNGEVDKLMPFASPLSDIIGSVDLFRSMVEKGSIEMVHTGFLRGRNFDNSIILVSECQNMSTDHIKLILGRIGTGSVVIFDGDLQQIDEKSFMGSKNGIMVMSNALRGNELYGQVTLDKVERSKTASLSDVITKYENI